jgi:hypothetical protein
MEPIIIRHAESFSLPDRCRILKNVVFANSGVLYKSTGPYFVGTINSSKQDGQACTGDNFTWHFVAVQSMGPSPSSAPAPFELR